MRKRSGERRRRVRRRLAGAWALDARLSSRGSITLRSSSRALWRVSLGWAKSNNNLNATTTLWMHRPKICCRTMACSIATNTTGIQVLWMPRFTVRMLVVEERVVLVRRRTLLKSARETLLFPSHKHGPEKPQRPCRASQTQCTRGARPLPIHLAGNKMLFNKTLPARKAANQTCGMTRLMMRPS
ncbi:hypothetical protein BC567DRAFT_228299 [Phyllosticta citribraziliensis]